MLPLPFLVLLQVLFITQTVIGHFAVSACLMRNLSYTAGQILLTGMNKTKSCNNEVKVAPQAGANFTK